MTDVELPNFCGIFQFVIVFNIANGVSSVRLV